MKFLLLPLLFLALLACQSRNGTAQTGPEDAAAVSQDGTVVGKVDRSAKLAQGPNAQPGQAPLIVRMGSATSKTGATVCLPVEVTNFKDMIGFQYTMAYDSAALVFKELRNFSLPGYSASNFGTRFADRGVVSTLWTDPGALTGQSRPENHPIYEICFENVQPAGQTTTVQFKDGPTRMEIIRKNMQQTSMAFANGRVTAR